MYKYHEETKRVRGCAGCKFDSRTGCNLVAVLRVDGSGRCLKRIPEQKFVCDNINMKSKEEQEEIYNKIISEGYSFVFEDNAVIIVKDNQRLYYFNTWVSEAPIISKLIWFGCYERNY